MALYRLVLIYFALSFGFISWVQAETSKGLKIDQKFKEENRLDLNDLYEKPADEKVPVTKEGVISYEDLPVLTNGRLPKVEIIFDSSGSMGRVIGQDKTRMYAAKRVVAKFFKDQQKENALMALRVYGSRRRNDCQDDYMAIGFGNKTNREIDKKISSLLPIGKTPLMASVDRAIKDIIKYSGEKRIVVFTDGKDTCGGDLCKFAKKVRGLKDVGLKIYTVGIGFKLKEQEFDQVACLGESGDNFMADDEDELFVAMSNLADELIPGINLKIISPIPKAPVNLFKIVNGKRKYYRSFTAAWGIRVPPGVYEAEVGLSPRYRFKRFKIPPKKRVVLKVEGFGKMKIDFPKGLINAQLLDENGKVAHHFKSGQYYRVKMGRYNLKVFRKPFFEDFLGKHVVSPNGVYKIPMPNVGSVIFEHPSNIGYYIYVQNGEFGEYMTNVPVVLPRGPYRFYISDECRVDGVDLGSNKNVGRVDCKK